jgi:putative copper resistance protein D
VELLVDLFGYLGIVLHGAAILARAMAVGGAAFLIAAARPLGVDAAAHAAWALAAVQILSVAMNAAVLADTAAIGAAKALGAQFALAGAAEAVAAIGLGVALRRAAPCPVLAGLGAAILLAAVATTHAVARLDGRAPLYALGLLHQFGACIWIGGIPAFLAALRAAPTPEALRRVGSRFSRVSMTGVACILASGVGMAWAYIGDLHGFYGTAYGVMVCAKIAMFGMLLGLGAGNFRLIERLRRDPGASVSRLRGFAEAEVGIGVAVFFAAASLTSVPPAADLRDDRATWAEIVERNTPAMPRLASPDHDSLALVKLQSKLDAEAAARKESPQAAFVPGAGDLPPREASDIAWSEYNHHWSGFFVVLVGAMALLAQGGIRWARHWPLVFLGLAGFLFLRSDPEVWPMGAVGFWESLCDVEVLQHRLYVVLVVAFAWFEWRVRMGKARGRAVYVFPLLCAAGGVLLLTHSHAIANVKEQLLIEITHTPLALAGIAAGWARWIEMRIDRDSHPVVWRAAGWIWPACILFCGLLLTIYREA